MGCFKNLWWKERKYKVYVYQNTKKKLIQDEKYR